MDEIISKAATLLEALPYVQRFRSQIFVVKYGGSFMDSPNEEERHRVARDVVFLEAVGINPVVVHGGGKAITRAIEQSGARAEFVGGQRRTDEATMEIVERVLSRDINPEIVKAIEDFGGKARGFSGTVIFRCRKFELTVGGASSREPGVAGAPPSTRRLPSRWRTNTGISPISP